MENIELQEKIIDSEKIVINENSNNENIIKKDNITINENNIITEKDNIITEKNYITPEKDNITTEKDNIITEKNNITIDENNITTDEDNIDEDYITINEDELKKNDSDDLRNEDDNLKDADILKKEERENNLPNTVIKNFEKSLKEQKKFTTLCFSGGGIKGLSFIGALEKLIEKKIINMFEIRKFVGTSAGSILAFLLTLGWEIEEIKEFVYNFNFRKLNGEINSIVFFEEYGIQDGDRLKLLFIKFLDSKLNVKDINFKDLYEKTKKKLIIIGTNLSKGKEEVFNYRTTPDFSVITALRISVSVPIIFSPIKIGNEYYIDGGIKNNFPISHCSKKTTIGFYVKNGCNNKIDSIKTFITSVLSVATDTISEKNIKKYVKNIVQIRNTEFNFIKFDYDLDFKKKLIILGNDSADDFIKNYYS
jgi:predicted acylesterase/phospholipase RssA